MSSSSDSDTTYTQSYESSCEKSSFFSSDRSSNDSVETNIKKKTDLTKNGKNRVKMIKKLFTIPILFFLNFSVIILIFIIFFQYLYSTPNGHKYVRVFHKDGFIESGEVNYESGGPSGGFISKNKQNGAATFYFNDYNELYKLSDEFYKKPFIINYNTSVKDEISVFNLKYETNDGGRRTGNGFYKNQFFLGSGYNIFKGNKLGLANPSFSDESLGDPGFRRSVLTPTTEKIFSQIQTSCSVEFESTLVENSNELYRHIGAGAEGKTNQWFRRGFDFLPTLNFNIGYTKNRIETNDYSFVFTMAKCLVYFTEINHLFLKYPMVNFDFYQKLEFLSNKNWDLLTEEQKEKYFFFIEEFGTHMVTKADMGAYYYLFTELDKYSLREKKVSKMGLFRAITKDALSSLDLNINKEKTINIQKYITRQHVRSFGARPYQSYHGGSQNEGTGISWASNAKIDPVPIDFSLSLIPEFYYYVLGIEGKQYLIEDKRIRNNLLISYDAYFTKLYPEIHKDVDTKCENGIVYQESLCIFSPEIKDNWVSARTRCEDFGGSLVTVKSKEKEEFIKKNFNDVETWIGLSLLGDGNEIKEAEWLWIDKTHVGYTNWHGNEPNHNFERCAEINFNVNRLWNSEECERELNFICECSFFPPVEVYTNEDLPFCDTSKENVFSIVENDQKKCITVFDFDRNWFNAKINCRTLFPYQYYSDMVMIRDEEKSNLIKEGLNELNLNQNNFWIGLNNLNMDWSWVNGKPLTFDNFKIKNVDSDSLCVTLEIDSFLWEKERCTNLRNFMCEYEYE